MRTIALGVPASFCAASLLVAAERSGPAVRPQARGAQVHVRGRGADPPHRAGHADHHVDRGLLRRRRDPARTRCRPRSRPSGHDNPQTGPFYVDGAEPGDTLAIRIEKLEPARDYGISSLFPGLRRAERHRPHGDAAAGPARDGLVLRRRSRPKGVARTRSPDGKRTWEVPARPVSRLPRRVAAHGEARSTIVPDNFGGNMDCPEVRAGNTIYLGVRVPGGARLLRRRALRAWATARSSARRSRAR